MATLAKTLASRRTFRISDFMLHNIFTESDNKSDLIATYEFITVSPKTTYRPVLVHIVTLYRDVTLFWPLKW
jgi:hypothetical protein